MAGVAERTDGTPVGEWIEGRGYDDNKLAEHRHISRWDLVAVSPHHPVAIKNASGHMCVVNSRALESAGITRETTDALRRHRAHRPDHRRAEWAVAGAGPGVAGPSFLPPGKEAIRRCMLAAGTAYLAAGITSSQEAGIMSIPEFTVFQELWASGELPLRIYTDAATSVPGIHGEPGHVHRLWRYRLRVGSFKLWRTAR